MCVASVAAKPPRRQTHSGIEVTPPTSKPSVCEVGTKRITRFCARLQVAKLGGNYAEITVREAAERRIDDITSVVDTTRRNTS